MSVKTRLEIMEIDFSYLEQKRIYCKDNRQFPASLGMLEAKEALVRERERESPAKVKQRSVVWLGGCCWHCHPGTHSHHCCWTPDACAAIINTNSLYVFVSFSKGSGIWAGSFDSPTSITFKLSEGKEKDCWALGWVYPKFIKWKSFHISRISNLGQLKVDKCSLQAHILMMVMMVIATTTMSQIRLV